MKGARREGRGAVGEHPARRPRQRNPATAGKNKPPWTNGWKSGFVLPPVALALTVEVFGESALVEEGILLAAGLATEEENRLVDQADDGIGRDFGIGTGHEGGEAGPAVAARVVIPCGRKAVHNFMTQTFPHHGGLPAVLGPEFESVLSQETLEVREKFVGVTGPGHIGEMHLQLAGSCRQPAALGDVANAAAGGLHHLVVRERRLSDEPVTENDRGIEDHPGQTVAAQPAVTTVRQKDIAGVGRGSEGIRTRGRWKVVF